MGTARGRVKHGTLHGIRRGGGGTTESDVRSPGRVLMVKDSGLRSTGYLPLSLSIYAETIFYFFFFIACEQISFFCFIILYRISEM